MCQQPSKKTSFAGSFFHLVQTQAFVCTKKEAPRLRLSPQARRWTDYLQPAKYATKPSQMQYIVRYKQAADT